ncbi:aminotransferase class V-fold PLP-dependent enzyme [Leptobacterium flavescens]|uniref:Aminotransferase class V-fold PLP-dependent enzyme n=1 Tax=Leptobacterium flavescens TaxID=472055 RepID=A0A6P0UPQ2_9FLAO|nr:aminotransferase class V-fold PLP-dependent enzyme [Leptobacterium flavescens]
MEEHFLKYRKGIIGINKEIQAVDGSKKKIVYADWTASGRNYQPIESRIQKEIMPLVANTHTETNSTGTAMTYSYHVSQQIIKQHVNAGPDDVIITAGSGMTRLVNKFQRILNIKGNRSAKASERPIVFVTHMEHHSNQTSWLETDADVEIIMPSESGLIDIDHFIQLLEQYKDRPLKIASVTACSNVTGIKTPYHKIAQLIHKENGYCFVDFACSAPYVPIDMHPKEEGAHLDAIFFSPHKFLGGPGSSGVMVFNKKLYNREVPDNPGGGTVTWTNPWGEHEYTHDIEAREDGGTPAFLQTIKTAMCIRLKEEMGIKNILARELHLLDLLWTKLEKIPNLHILASEQRNRLPIISFYIDGLHHNLGVRLLNDKFGIQCRGGCSCAGTYGHFLLNVTPKHSKQITDKIDKGDHSSKPGWIRVSLHPTMTDKEIYFISESIAELARKHSEWKHQYSFDPSCNELSSVNGQLDSDIKYEMLNALNRNFVPQQVQNPANGFIRAIS